MEGDEITVTWGKETFWPTRSYGFELGPFCITTRIRKGETVKDAMKRVYDALEIGAELIYKSKRRDFHDRARHSGQ